MNDGNSHKQTTNHDKKQIKSALCRMIFLRPTDIECAMNAVQHALMPKLEVNHGLARYCMVQLWFLHIHESKTKTKNKKKVVRLKI